MGHVAQHGEDDKTGEDAGAAVSSREDERVSARECVEVRRYHGDCLQFYMHDYCYISASFSLLVMNIQVCRNDPIICSTLRPLNREKKIHM